MCSLEFPEKRAPHVGSTEHLVDDTQPNDTAMRTLVSGGDGWMDG